MPRRMSPRRLAARLTSRRSIVVLLAVCVALVPMSAVAAEILSGEEVVIASPVADDVYVFGAEVTIDADVDGDVIVTAADVRINGNVSGSVYAAAFNLHVRGNVGGVVMATASDVTITGDVGGTARIVSSTLEIDGARIGGDLVAVATEVNVRADAHVAGDVIVRSTNVELLADVDGVVRGSADSLEIGGVVGGKIDVRVGTLRFVDGAVVTQPVEYTSDREVLVDGGTTITGTLTRVEPDHPTTGERFAESALWAVFRYMWALALGAFLLRVAPRLVVRSANIVRSRPFPALGWGFLGMLGVPLVVGFLFVTVIGIPVAMVLLACFILALYASQIVIGMIVGTAVAPRNWRGSDQLRHAVGTLAFGLAIVVAVRSLPIDGWSLLTGLSIAMIVLGSLLMQLFRRDASGTAASGHGAIG